MEVIIPWIAWYFRYFRITKEEFELFNSDGKGKLDELAESFTGSDGIKNNSERFIRSDLQAENT
jgi:hypothetical protein